MTCVEWERFGATVNAFRESGKWDEFAHLHTDPDVWNVAHSDGERGGLQAAFLPWHRAYLHRMERELQKIDPEVTLPYWNWALDSENPLGSVVLSDLFFGTTGKPEDSYCVTDGYFRSASNETACIKRGIPADAGGFLTLSNLKEVLVESPDYGRFVNTMENGLGLHGHLHMFLGGNMANLNSPRDPLFYAHHAFIDMLWWRWQRMHNSMTSPAYKGDAEAPLYPFKESAYDVFSVEEMGYTYSNPLERDPADNATIPCYVERGGGEDIVALGERVWTSLPNDLYRLRSIPVNAPKPATRFFTRWLEFRNNRTEMEEEEETEVIIDNIEQVARVLSTSRVRSNQFPTLGETAGLGMPLELILSSKRDEGSKKKQGSAKDEPSSAADSCSPDIIRDCGSCLRTPQEIQESQCVDTYPPEFRQKLTRAMVREFEVLRDEPMLKTPKEEGPGKGQMLKLEPVNGTASDPISIGPVPPPEDVGEDQGMPPMPPITPDPLETGMGPVGGVIENAADLMEQTVLPPPPLDDEMMQANPPPTVSPNTIQIVGDEEEEEEEVEEDKKKDKKKKGFAIPSPLPPQPEAVVDSAQTAQKKFPPNTTPADPPKVEEEDRKDLPKVEDPAPTPPPPPTTEDKAEREEKLSVSQTFDIVLDKVTEVLYDNDKSANQKVDQVFTEEVFTSMDKIMKDFPTLPPVQEAKEEPPEPCSSSKYRSEDGCPGEEEDKKRREGKEKDIAAQAVRSATLPDTSASAAGKSSVAADSTSSTSSTSTSGGSASQKTASDSVFGASSGKASTPSSVDSAITKAFSSMRTTSGGTSMTNAITNYFSSLRTRLGGSAVAGWNWSDDEDEDEDEAKAAVVTAASAQQEARDASREKYIESARAALKASEAKVDERRERLSDYVSSMMARAKERLKQASEERKQREQEEEKAKKVAKKKTTTTKKKKDASASSSSEAKVEESRNSRSSFLQRLFDGRR